MDQTTGVDALDYDDAADEAAFDAALADLSVPSCKTCGERPRVDGEMFCATCRFVLLARLRPWLTRVPARHAQPGRRRLWQGGSAAWDDAVRIVEGG